MGKPGLICAAASALAGVLTAGPAQGQVAPNTSTGNELMAICDSPKDDPLWWLCGGHIVGFSQGFQLRDQIAATHLMCMPDSATNQQIRDIAVIYIRANPQLRHEPSSSLIGWALVKAFPCPVRK